MNNPIITRPMAPPTGAPNPKDPKLRFRIFPGGNVVPMIATQFGITNAAPIPLMALAIEKIMISCVQKPLMSDHIIHQAPPQSSTFLCPYTAPIRPLTRTKAPCVRLYVLESFVIYQKVTYGYAAATQVAVVGLSTPNECPISKPPPRQEPNEINWIVIRHTRY